MGNRLVNSYAAFQKKKIITWISGRVEFQHLAE